MHKFKEKILHLGCAVKFYFRTHRTITVREYQYSGKKNPLPSERTFGSK